MLYESDLPVSVTDAESCVAQTYRPLSQNERASTPRLRLMEVLSSDEARNACKVISRRLVKTEPRTANENKGPNKDAPLPKTKNAWLTPNQRPLNKAPSFLQQACDSLQPELQTQPEHSRQQKVPNRQQRVGARWPLQGRSGRSPTGAQGPTLWTSAPLPGRRSMKSSNRALVRRNEQWPHQSTRYWCQKHRELQGPRDRRRPVPNPEPPQETVNFQVARQVEDHVRGVRLKGEVGFRRGST